MRRRWIASFALSLGMLAAVAVAAPNKPGIEVIDLDPPPHKTELPPAPAPAAEEDVKTEAESESTPVAAVAIAGPKTARTAAIEEKKLRRLETIRAFFGKMKSEVEVPASRPSPARIEEPEVPVAPARGRRPAAESDDSNEETASAPGGLYKVQRGDTLAKISKRFYGSTRKFQLIADANNLSPTDRIHVGQELTIPAGEGTARARPAAARPSVEARAPAGRPAPRVAAHASVVGKPAAATGQAPQDGRIDYASYDFTLYQVQAGDTLASVADKFYRGKGDPSLIKLYNKGKTIAPGEKILIPLPKKVAAGKAQKGT